MKTFLVLAVALFFAGSTHAQGGLINKIKNKVKGQGDVSGKNSGNTVSPQPISANNAVGDDEYVRALGKKHSGMIELKYLRGTNELAISQYYDHAAETDMANFYLVMQKKGKPTGDGANDYEEILGMRDAYPQLYKKDFQPLLNTTIEGAYQLRKTNILEAVQNLKLAIRFNSACLMVIPDMPAALELKDELEKALAAIGGEQAKVYTSDFHKKNQGKILFSKEPIIPGKENPAQFITSFGPSDQIYAMAYLPGSIKDLTGSSENSKTAPGQYRLKLDGQDISGAYTLDFNHNKEDLKNAWFPIEVRPDITKAKHGLDAVYFAERFADLSPRKHVFGLYFTMTNNYNEPFAYGEFNLDWTSGDAAKMMTEAKKTVAVAQDNYYKAVGLDEFYYKPNYAFKDPSLSVANLKKIIMASRPEIVQILKLVTSKENATEDWTIHTNDLGVPYQKSTNHFTSIAYKAKDGKCYTLEVIQFLSQHLGGGRYGNVVMGSYGQVSRFGCENIK